jgi:uncharacterized protein (TIGR03118 family)
MSANFLQTNLVSDVPGLAANLDPNLANPWGIAASATGPFWVANNGSGTSTLYDTQGNPQPLVVNIPAPGDPLGASGAPTGTVFNTDPTGFVVSNDSGSAPAAFLFAAEDGTISGWSPRVDGTHAIIAVDNSSNPSIDFGAVYKGLTMATDSNGQTLLYATNFSAATIDVFNDQFQQVRVPGGFHDSHIPFGFAPFNIRAIGDKLYVAYAMQDSDRHDDFAGPGNGFVDVFGLDGTLQTRLVAHGPLNSPFGLVKAPANFGDFSNALLVGNFGDGQINAFDPDTGAFLGTLNDTAGNPIVVDGLWALRFGNGGSGGDANKLYFTAGIQDEQHGLFGSLESADTGVFSSARDALRAAARNLLASLRDVVEDGSSASAGDRAALAKALARFEAALDQLVAGELGYTVKTQGGGLQGGVSAGHRSGGHLTGLDSLFADPTPFGDDLR